MCIGAIAFQSFVSNPIPPRRKYRLRVRLIRQHSAPCVSDVVLNEAFLAKIAGWEAVKAARQLLAGGKVLSSNYTPPILKGVVQEGTISYRSGLVLKSGIDLENLCSCRASRQWGTICAHSVAVGLHHLKPAA